MYRWTNSSYVKIALDSARQHSCKVGLSIAAGKSGRICSLSIDSVHAPAKAAAAPLHTRNTFVKFPQQQLAKSREERAGRQMIMKQPLTFDMLILRMLLPHVDAKAPPGGLCVNMRSS